MKKLLPHEQRIYNLREQVLDLCEHCEKNDSKERRFRACDADPTTYYPFHECPERIEKQCIDCKYTFEVPVIAYLWMTKCPDCYKTDKKYNIKGLDQEEG